MNIGYVNPNSQLSVDVTTLLKQFVKDGHKVVLMTLSPKGHLHEVLQDSGVVFEYLDDGKPKQVHQSLPKAKDVVRLCKKYDFDIVYNNFAMAQMLGLLSSPFCKAKMIYLRHHSTNAAQEYSNWKGILVDKLMNKFSPKMVVPSLLVRQDVINEGFPSKDVVMIPYCYDFASYPKAEEDEVQEIKNRFRGKRILLMISRYVPQKRYELAVEIAVKLRDQGVKDFVFLCLGDGHLEDDIRKQIADNNLQDIFFLEGFQTNVIKYIAAAELLVHPSASEASCHAIKEAGWIKKNVICCHDVGDFSEYLIDRKNAFVVGKDAPVEPMVERIREFLENKIEDYAPMAEELHKSISVRFTPEAVIVKHYELIDSMLGKK